MLLQRIAFGVLGALVLAVSLGVHAYTHNLAQSLLAGAACALLSYVYGVWPYRQLPHIPGPEPHVFFGHYHEIIKYGVPDFYRRVARQYGKVAKIFEGRQPVVLISDPELTRQVGMKLFKSFHNRPKQSVNLRFRENFGLLVLEGEQWKRIRSALVPTFSDAQLKSFQPAMHAAIENFLDNLHKHHTRSPSEPIEMFSWWGAMTMEAIGSTSFGVQFPTQEFDSSKAHPISEAAETFFKLARHSNNYALHIVKTFPFLAPFVAVVAFKQLYRMLRLFKVLDAASLEITQNRRKDPKMDQYHDFVTLLLQARDPNGNPLNDKEIRDQENTFLLAGFETTASSLSFVCFLLAQHPRVHEKLLLEIDTLAPNGHTPTFEELDSFKYLDCVINESSRLYPVAMIVREANEDTEIGGFAIPKGTSVYCPAFTLHYDPQSYKDPEEFIPERFRCATQSVLLVDWQRERERESVRERREKESGRERTEQKFWARYHSSGVFFVAWLPVKRVKNNKSATSMLTCHSESVLECASALGSHKKS